MAVLLLKEITPPATYAGVCEDRRRAIAKVMATENQHVVITNLAVAPQQVTQDPALAALLNLVGRPPRILLQVVSCELPSRP